MYDSISTRLGSGIYSKCHGNCTWKGENLGKYVSMCTHTSHFVTDKGEDNPGVQSYNCLIVATSLGAHVYSQNG